MKLNFEHYRLCEIDRFAVKSYNAIHGTEFATSDITTLVANDLGIVDTDKYGYVVTYSFPCQDLSYAGKQTGMAKGSGTRSGLLWEVERLLTECTELPQILLMENVPAVIRPKNIKHFREWLEFLKNLGYKSYCRCLNAKNYGIPQSRDRCFMVSILGDLYYEFPERKELTLRLKDMLEDDVDEKFYITDGKIKLNERNVSKSIRCGGRGSLDKKHLWDLVEVENKGLERCKKIGLLTNGKWDKAPDVAKRIYDYNSISPVITAMRGGNLEPKIIDPQGRKSKKIKPSTICPTLRAQIHGNPPQVMEPVIIAQRGREPNVLSPKRTEYGKQIRKQYESGEITEQRKNIQQLEPRYDGLTNTLTTVQKDNLLLINYLTEPIVLDDTQGFDGTRLYTEFVPTLRSQRQGLKVREPIIYDDYNSNIRTDQNTIGTITSTIGNSAERNGYKLIEPSNCRIRKLTPKECWRLMGFDDEDFDKAKASGVSNSQLYKQAGNSIVVNVLEGIFKKIFINQ